MILREYFLLPLSIKQLGSPQSPRLLRKLGNLFNDLMGNRCLVGLQGDLGAWTP